MPTTVFRRFDPGAWAWRTGRQGVNMEPQPRCALCGEPTTGERLLCGECYNMSQLVGEFIPSNRSRRKYNHPTDHEP